MTSWTLRVESLELRVGLGRCGKASRSSAIVERVAATSQLFCPVSFRQFVYPFTASAPRNIHPFPSLAQRESGRFVRTDR